MDATHNHTMGSSLVGQASVTAAPQIRSFAAATTTYTTGIDVSGYQTFNAGNWVAMYGAGVRFVYVKATEGTTYKSSQFSEQYTDSYNAGMTHGAYHFANPDSSSGAAQATFFVNNGGGWTPDGRTLPPVVDLESEGSSTCYGLSQSAMVAWIADFSSTVMKLVGRLPGIYTNPSWWSQCTGNSSAFTANPLYLARWVSSISSGPGTLPGGWPSLSLWQWTDSGTVTDASGSQIRVDQDAFPGTTSDLTNFATENGFLIRSTTSSSLYLYAGSQKYYVPSMDIADQYAALGSVSYVPQSYLDSIPTANANASLAVRDISSGAISLIQNGQLHHFATCDLVAAYGYQCAATTDLPSFEYAMFPTGPAITPFFVTNGDPTVYDLVSGTRYPVYSWTDVVQLDGGTSPFVTTMASTAAQAIPIGNTIVAPASLLKTATNDAIYFTDGYGRKYQITSFDIAADFGSSGYRTVPDSVVSGYATGSGYLSVAAQCAGQQYVASQGTLIQWNSSANAGGLPTTALDPVTCAYIPHSGSLSGTLFVKPTNSSTVYEVSAGRKIPMYSWTELMAVTGGTVPVIVPLNPGTVASIPLTPYSLQPGTVGRSVSNPSVYVFGEQQRIPVYSLTTTAELGLPNWNYVDPTTLSNYTAAAAPITRVVVCGSTAYFGIAGTLYPLTSSSVTGISPTTLDPAVCSQLSFSTAASRSKVFATESGSPTIYMISGGQKHPVSSWTDLIQLNGGTVPDYLTTTAGGLGDIPRGSSV